MNLFSTSDFFARHEFVTLALVGVCVFVVGAL